MLIIFRPLSNLTLRVREGARSGSTCGQSYFYYHIIEILKHFVLATTGLFFDSRSLEPAVQHKGRQAGQVSWGNLERWRFISHVLNILR
jgi:hypothetical protein